MALGRKQAGSDDGWSAVIFEADRVVVADVQRRPAARPRVRACESFAREGSELEVLKRLKNTKRLAHNRCTTLLGHGQYQLLQLEAPEGAKGLPRAELREAMRWRIKEMVDFPVEEAGIDLLEIPATGSRAPQLWVVAASRAVLQARIWAFQDAKVPLAAIDIPELAQRNLAALFEEANRGLALVSFDAEGGLLTISFQGELFVTRHIDVGAPELVGAQTESLHERVLLDIQRTLDNFDRNYSAIPLNRLKIGPLPGGEAFLAYLAANLSLPVARAELAEVLEIDAVPQLSDATQQAQAWLALGAALRES